MLNLVKLCLAPCCSCLQSPVVREDMSYVFCTKEKLDRLESAMKDLMVKKHDIERELNLPQNKGKQPNNQLQLQRWISKVGEKYEQVTQLLDEYNQGCCVRGPCCLKCSSRYRISRDAINLLNEITPWQGEKLEVSFIDQQPPKPVPESCKIVGKKISSNLNMALSYLADETVSMIGICGMGGVGKTTLLKKISQSLLGDAIMGLNHVLFIEASKDIQLEELHRKIAKSLHLEPSACKEDIFNVLKISNFVLLLDNIWEEVDLINLGIPHPHSDDNSTKQYKHKVIFTARSENVCAWMRASKRIKVECLEQDEAWELFKDNVNLDIIESDEKIQEIAWQVMEKCNGVPLVLKVFGKAMSNKKTVDEWEFILSSLKNSSTEVVQGVEESLFPILKFSYDNLPNNMNIKECFLATSMLRGASIDELFKCWMGLGLISDVVSIQEAYNKAKYILNILEESCLLDSFFRGNVLHDVTYEMAMWIASDCGATRNKWIVKEYNELVPTKDAENWRFANRVILEGYFKLLPILSHQCSDLFCLIIRNNKYLEKVPEGFFKQIPNLTYLDLSGTGIKELPKDIKCLVNLQYLNISSMQISSFPKALANMNKLQYLICRYLICKAKDGLMSSLQELKIIDLYPNGWVEPEGLKILKKHMNIKAIGMRVASQEVLQQLSYLPTTELYIENLDSLISLSFDALSCKNHRSLHELEIISCPQLEELVMNGSEPHLNNLKICHAKKLQKIIWTNISPPKFFHKLKNLFIYKCNLGNFSWVLYLPCLLSLTVKNCPEIEMMFHVGETEIQHVSKIPMFPALKNLHLSSLPKLVSMSNVALDFPQLSGLSVHQCLNLKKLPFKHDINNCKIISIYGERKWWESLEWDDATIPSHLSPNFPLSRGESDASSNNSSE